MKILQISPQIPFPLDEGEKLQYMELPIISIKEGIRLTLLHTGSTAIIKFPMMFLRIFVIRIF
jgi:hypothetical protein